MFPAVLDLSLLAKANFSLVSLLLQLDSVFADEGLQQCDAPNGTLDAWGGTLSVKGLYKQCARFAVVAGAEFALVLSSFTLG